MMETSCEQNGTGDLFPRNWVKSEEIFSECQNTLEGSIGFMERSNFTSEQIVFALRQAESGTPVIEVCRKMGIVKQTFYRWKKKYIGMRVAEVRRLKILEEENQNLKQLVADLLGPWVMCHQLNLHELKWQNSWENHLMIDPKTGYTSTAVTLT